MYMAGLNGPTFYNAQGQPIVSIVCGQPYTFGVPGVSEIWLSQMKNGQPGYNGVLPVPMPSYVADCVSEVGVYYNAAFVVDRSSGQPKPGAPLGSVTFQVLPQASATPAAGPGAGQGGQFTPTSSTTAPVIPPPSSPAPVIMSTGGGGGYVPPDFGGGIVAAPGNTMGDFQMYLLIGGAALVAYLLGRK